MPLITVQMFPGRTAEEKAALASGLTDIFLETCGRRGQSRDGIWVVIDEVPSEHWAVAGRSGLTSVSDRSEVLDPDGTGRIDR